MNKLEKIYLHTGSNLGQKEQQLDQARQLIGQTIGQVTAQSQVYETEAWGLPDQPNFVNQALEVETALSPDELINRILSIEQKMGRIRSEKWTARLIDIDIIFYSDKIIKTEKLTIPHPFMHERNFVLIPLVEIAGNFIHPELQTSIKELYERSKDQLKVKVYQF